MDEVPLTRSQTFRPGLRHWAALPIFAAWLVACWVGGASAIETVLHGSDRSTAAAWLLVFAIIGVTGVWWVVRGLMGRDTVEWGPVGVTVQQFPFSRRRFVPREAVERVECVGGLYAKAQDESLSINALTLAQGTDEDGHAEYRLTVATPTSTVDLGVKEHDPDEALELGRWLSRHAGVTLELPTGLRSPAG